MFEIEKAIKKFNLNFIKKTIIKNKIEINQISELIKISASNEKNFGLVIEKNIEFDKIKENIDKINLIIISNVKDLSDVLKEKYISLGRPILLSEYSQREIILIIDSFILRKQQTPERVHSTLLSIFGQGVLIMGKSGIGKSELALELINRKHLFIGDDAIDVISFAGKGIGKAPKISRDFIEVRGVGIINIKGMFGIQSVMKETEIELIVELVLLDDIKSSVDRLGKEYLSKIISKVKIPLIQIPISSGRSIASVVEAAVISYKQRKEDNYIAVDDLTERFKNN